MNVVVRWARVDSAPLDDAELSRGERERLEAFRDDADRRRFVGARLLLRSTVATSLGVPPGAVTLHQRCDRCAGAHGRPAVTVGGRPGPHVSVTHAGDVAAVALAARGVGVDLEPGGPSDDDRRRWVRVEALLKATGHGLDVDPALVTVSPVGAAPRLLEWRGPGRRPAVRLADVEVPGYVATVARLGRRRLDVEAAEWALS